LDNGFFPSRWGGLVFAAGLEVAVAVFIKKSIVFKFSAGVGFDSNLKI